jgi:hypothetical protein
MFVTDCYTFLLEGFDAILGVQWLKSLGPIVWDFVASPWHLSVKAVLCGYLVKAAQGTQLTPLSYKLTCFHIYCRHTLTYLLSHTAYCHHAATTT